MKYLMMFKKQFLSIFKNKGLMILLFIGPAFLTCLFAGVYLNDYVQDIPMAILDEDNSSLSHYVSHAFLTDEHFNVVQYPSSRQKLQELIDEGKVHIGLWIPQGFESEAITYQSTQILALMDGSNNVVAGNAYAKASLIIQSISAGVKMRLIQGKGLQPQMAENLALLYNVGERVLYDSKMTYMNYLIICFLAVFLQQLFLSAIGSMLIREEDLLCEEKTVANVLGASSACILGILPSAYLSLFLLNKFFHVPIRGDIKIVALMTILFLLSLTGPALIMASLTKDRVKYAQFSFMLSVPTFVTSGSIWPLDQMPKFLESLVRIFWPLINYGKIAQEVLIKNMDFQTVQPHLKEMLLYFIAWLAIGIIIYKKRHRILI